MILYPPGMQVNGERKMERVEYKGYIIQASPYRLADEERWIINGYIEDHQGDKIIITKFFAADTYPTREEAVDHSINCGRQFVDKW